MLPARLDVTALCLHHYGTQLPASRCSAAPCPCPERRLDLLGAQFGVDSACASFEDIVEQLDDCAMETLGGCMLIQSTLAPGLPSASQLLPC